MTKELCKETTVKLSIGTTDVFLIDYDEGKGKIVISDSDFDYNFSFYWGAMGSNLKDFLLSINESYFCGKLLPHYDNGEFDEKGTFKEIRKHIKEEILNWYEHMEFQKDMREKLNDFQRDCYDDRSFVEQWDSFVKYNLDYYLIDDRYDRKEVESSFNGICEPWNFIVMKPSRQHIWLKKFYKKLQKELNKN